MIDRERNSGDEPLMPEEMVETPCFVVYEERLIGNLLKSIEACGGAGRFMPHVKTHRAAWVVKLARRHGVEAFKAATPAEVEMVAGCGAKTVTYAFPTVNPANVARVVRCAAGSPETEFVALVDSDAGMDVWRRQIQDGPANIRLRVDLDPDFGRTGIAMDERAVDLAGRIHDIGRFAGWHLYDGHVAGSREERRARVEAEADAVARLDGRLAERGFTGDLVAGGSYTFDLWSAKAARYVSPGSWTYSSSQHDDELGDLGWKPAAFVLSTVISSHEGTVTLDAGVKAIAPDKPTKERFRTDGEIVLMSEEHTILRADGLRTGDRLLLVPRHACTTAYLYDRALVRTTEGNWEMRPQLGAVR